MEPQRLGLWALLGEAWRAFVRHWRLAGLTLLGLVITAFITPFLGLAVLSYAQFELTHAILAERGLALRKYGRWRYFAVLGAQALVWIVISIGWTILILPGVFVMLRFYYAVPVLIVEDVRVFDALAISWRRTASQELVLLGATVAAYLPAIVFGTLGVVAVAAGAGIVAAVPILLALFILPLAPMLSACVAAVGYAGEANTRHLERVFS